MLIDSVRDSLEHGFAPVGEALLDQAAQCAARGDYDRARQRRDALHTLADAVVGAHRNRMLARCAELVAARPTPQRGWEIHVIRNGRLAAAGVAAAGQDPRTAVEHLRDLAEAPLTDGAAGPAGSLTELSHLHSWLGQDGVRLVVVEPEGLALPWTQAHVRGTPPGRGPCRGRRAGSRRSRSGPARRASPGSPRAVDPHRSGGPQRHRRLAPGRPASWPRRRRRRPRRAAAKPVGEPIGQGAVRRAGSQRGRGVDADRVGDRRHPGIVAQHRFEDRGVVGRITAMQGAGRGSGQAQVGGVDRRAGRRRRG